MVPPTRAPLRVDRLRALNVPRQVAVELDGRGRPWAIMDERGRAGPSGDKRRRTVASTGEVWRVDDEWWRERISRRYFDVVLEGGKHMVLFEDLMTSQWWIQLP
jgi:hypothetical protein